MSKREKLSYAMQWAMTLLAVAGIALYLHAGHEDKAERLRQEYEEAKEEELDRARDKLLPLLSEMLSRVDVAYWQWDYTSDEVLWSDGLYEMFGIEGTPRMTYDDWVARVHPDDRQRADEICRHSAEVNEPYLMRYRIITPDGEVRTILEAASSEEEMHLMVGVCLWERDPLPEQHTHPDHPCGTP